MALPALRPETDLWSRCDPRFGEASIQGRGSAEGRDDDFTRARNATQMATVILPGNAELGVEIFIAWPIH